LSRRHEYEADAFARQAVGGAAPVVDALRKLAQKNLSNLTPHPLYSGFYYSHPTVVEREQALARRAEAAAESAAMKGRGQAAVGRWLAALLAGTMVAGGARAGSITVATYNVENYVAADRRVDDGYRPAYPKPEPAKTALRAVIRALDADVLALQEMVRPGTWRNCGAICGRRAGLSHATLAEAVDVDRHVAVLSRLPLGRVQAQADLDFPYGGGRAKVKRGLLEVAVTVDGTELTLSWCICTAASPNAPTTQRGHVPGRRGGGGPRLRAASLPGPGGRAVRNHGRLQRRAQQQAVAPAHPARDDVDRDPGAGDRRERRGLDLLLSQRRHVFEGRLRARVPRAGARVARRRGPRLRRSGGARSQRPPAGGRAVGIAWSGCFTLCSLACGQTVDDPPAQPAGRPIRTTGKTAPRNAPQGDRQGSEAFLGRLSFLSRRGRMVSFRRGGFALARISLDDRHHWNR